MTIDNLGKHNKKQSYANTRTTGKEQYYTTPEVVDICLDYLSSFINLENSRLLEPAGGTGEFIEGLKRRGIPETNIESYDIEPKHPNVKEADYLSLTLEFDDYVSISNPPFGRASSLAKKFFNHAAEHSKFICYLVPKAWRKWSVQNSLDPRFHLIGEIELPKDCFYLPDSRKGKGNVLSTIFQIWEKREEPRQKIKIPDYGLLRKIKPIDGKVIGANFEMIVFGYSCGKCAEVTEQIIDCKTTTMYFYIEREDVKEALRNLDLSKYSKNVSYVQALSIQEINYELNKIFSLPNTTS